MNGKYRPWLTLGDVGSQGLGLGHSPTDVRLKPDIYHCMDYHAALAPLYLEDMEDWKGPILVGERWWWWLLILDGGVKGGFGD